MTKAYRLCSKRYSPNSGAGAARYPGRWNAEGVEVVYAAESVSLAVLEIIVNYAVLPLDHVLTRIEAPDDVSIEILPDGELPGNWDAPEPVQKTQEIGSKWAQEARSALLSVPSSIIRSERNILINPYHRDFIHIFFSSPEPFAYDTRLKK